MAEERGTYAYMVDWLKMLGYSVDTRMQAKIAEYFGWFTASNDWYSYQVQRQFRTFVVNRDTLHPAALAAEAWSDLLMNEKLEIKAEDKNMAKVIADHFDNFGVNQADFVTRAFAMGTGAWAIGVDDVSDDGMVHPDARIKIEDYGASQIMPITWSADSCTQCAFATRVELDGHDYDQCQAHVLIGGTYHILTQLFDVKSHKMVWPDGVTEDLDTLSSFQTFALVKPAVPNIHFDYCAMGASVFEKGISAIKATDEALTSFLAHLRVGRPKVFVSDTLIEKKTSKTASGETITTYAAFGEADDIVFRTKPADEGTAPMNVVQPNMCVAENEQGINAGLKMLALTCGLGDNYWEWDHKTGLKTATEVVSDSSMLARTLRKHQNALNGSILKLVKGVAGVCKHLCNNPVNPEVEVSIDFDDSIITDTQTDRNMALTEISMLGIPALKRKYLVDYKGFTEDEATAAVPDETMAIDEGF